MTLYFVAWFCSLPLQSCIWETSKEVTYDDILLKTRHLSQGRITAFFFATYGSTVEPQLSGPQLSSMTNS